MAAKVPGSDLRVAAAVPDVAGGPFGLGWLPCAIATVVLLGLAALAWCFPALARGRGRARGYRSRHGANPGAAELPSCRRRHRRRCAKPARGAERRPTSRWSLIDRGIFRAYDVRGVVGQTLDAGIAELLGQSIGSRDAAAGPARHRGRPRRPPVRSGADRRPDRRPAQGRPQRHRHRHGADAGGVFRRLPPARGLLRVGHRQPQPARLQRLQDRGRRRNPVRRRHHRPVRPHRRRPPVPGRRARQRPLSGRRRRLRRSASPTTCRSTAR